MNILTDRALVPARQHSVRHLLFRITAPGRLRPADRPAVEVALVLDRSGSMDGTKIRLARQAVNHAIQVLQERDRLALVCFDTEIETLMASTHATAEAKALALDRLRDVDARGGTDLHGGWTTGAAHLRSTPSSGSADADAAIRRVLLLTDGQANHGVTDHDTLATVASELATAGIATTCFGLGADFDEALLARLSRNGKGNFYFIEAPGQIADYLTSELGEALEVVARDASLALTGGPGVRLTCLHDFHTESAADGSALRIRLGDLVAEQQLTVIVAVECDGVESGRSVCVSAGLGDRDAVLFPQPMNIEWRAVDQADDAAQPVAAEVVLEVASVLAARARSSALAANRAGDLVQSRRIIRAAVEAIRLLAMNVPGVQRVADALEHEIERYEQRMSEMVLKRTHYDSTSYLRSRDVRGKARRTTAS